MKCRTIHSLNPPPPPQSLSTGERFEEDPGLTSDEEAILSSDPETREDGRLGHRLWNSPSPPLEDSDDDELIGFGEWMDVSLLVTSY